MPVDAYARALRLLALRDRGLAELRGKLTEAGHPPIEIDEAIARVTALGYLDDARVAGAWARTLLAAGRRGPRAIEAKLKRLGFDKEHAETAIAAALEESGADEERLAREALTGKRRVEAASGEPKLRARAIRFLMGRGFSAGAAIKAVGWAGSEEE